MVAQTEDMIMSVEEYLSLEEVSPLKHAYVDGHVYAMSGGTLTHDTIANNVRGEIRTHLRTRGGPCRPFGPDVRLRVSPTVYYYPDALVICEADLDFGAIEVTAPCLIVEVLSHSTEADDRGGKFADYQTLEKFEEYVLVDSRRRAVECFRRTEHGLWLYQRYDGDATITLETVGLTRPIAIFYEDTPLAQGGTQ